MPPFHFLLLMLMQLVLVWWQQVELRRVVLPPSWNKLVEVEMEPL